MEINDLRGMIDSKTLVVRNGDQYFRVSGAMEFNDCVVLELGGQFLPESGGIAKVNEPLVVSEEESEDEPEEDESKLTKKK